MRYWLVKSEPFKYSWSQLLEDKETVWDGVRNYQARNNLREMKLGDLVLFYHSNEGLCVVGLAKVSKEAYPDPTTDDERWVAVSIKPLETLASPVTLAAIKAEPALADIGLVRQGRLSVVELKREEFDFILMMGESGSQKAEDD